MDGTGNCEDRSDESPDEGAGGVEHPSSRDQHPVAELLAEAAEAAEGCGAESTEVGRHVAARLARAVAGFVLVGAGIALLPLPGPGWIVIVVGLGLLPYAWARRMVSEIRSRIPGIPAEGRIPPRTLVLYGVLVAVMTAALMAFGGRLGDWLVSFGDPGTLWG